jgi:DNA-binding LacI/PurR family transcriptional regulator
MRMPGKARRETPPAPRRLTMKQIGQLVGVSQSTVSRVLSGAASIVPVAEDTRARILQVVAESGYTPNPLARALRGARTGLLGLIVRDIDDPFFGMAIAAITAVARDTGYNVVLGHVRSSAAEAIALREVLEMGHCDGAILLGDLRDQTRLLGDLVGHPTPLVGIWQGRRARTIPVVNVDNRAGVAVAVQHLLELGHQRIAFLQGGRTGDGIERRDAFLAAMRARDLDSADEYVQVADNAFSDAAMAMDRLLSLSRRPTAVLASTDVAAIGALKAASRAGLRVPDDLSLVGFDDIPLAEFVIPSLTTVHQPIDQIARASLQQLLKLIGGAQPKPRQQTLLPSLVARDSTAPPPKELA